MACTYFKNFLGRRNSGILTAFPVPSSRNSPLNDRTYQKSHQISRFRNVVGRIAQKAGLGSWQTDHRQSLHIIKKKRSDRTRVCTTRAPYCIELDGPSQNTVQKLNLGSVRAAPGICDFLDEIGRVGYLNNKTLYP